MLEPQLQPRRVGCESLAGHVPGREAILEFVMSMHGRARLLPVRCTSAMHPNGDWGPPRDGDGAEPSVNNTPRALCSGSPV